MKIKKSIILSLMLLLICSPAMESKRSKRKKEKELIKLLPEKYKQWVNLTTHIIAPTERSVFLNLKNDRDRELYINFFWKVRDPTPGTDENELRAEHIKRFKYSNKYFKYGAGRPGWMTDMGKIHIILGKADSIDRYDMDNVVVPCQIWSYYAKKLPNLPSHFYIVFFKKASIGEFKIYDPVIHSPFALLRRSQATVNANPFDYRHQYELIRTQHPILAMASLSLVPDDVPMDFKPSFRSQILLNNVFELPVKRINSTYATNFLKYKGVVKVDHTTNYIEAKYDVYIVKNIETGLDFLHFSILPQRVSVGFSEEKDKYFFNFNITVSLKKDKQTIFGYQKKFPFYIKDETELKDKFSNSIIISDYFPVPEGKFKLTILIQNMVNKEISYFEKNISIQSKDRSSVTIIGPMLSYDVKRLYRYAFLPFKFGDIEATINPKREFGTEDKIFVIGGINRKTFKNDIKGIIEVKNIFNPEKFSKKIPIDIPSNRTLFYFSQELDKMPSGSYSIKIKALTRENILLDMSESDFSVSLLKKVPRPSKAFKITSSDNIFSFYHIVGHQYKNLKKPEKALMYLKRAYQIKPDHPGLIRDYCYSLLQKKEFNRVLEIIEKIKGNQKNLFIYFLIKGTAFFYKGKNDAAIKNLEKANEIFDSDIRVLNVLGYAYLKIGKKERAKKVFLASLIVNKNQKKITALLKKIN